MERFLRALTGLADVAIRRHTFRHSSGWTPPTAWQRIQAMLHGRSRLLDEMERINAQPALVIEKDGVVLRIVYSDGPKVATEAVDLAGNDIPDLASVTAQFEMDGDDRHLVLKKAYTTICNALHDEGSFVLYSGQSGVWERTS